MQSQRERKRNKMQSIYVLKATDIEKQIKIPEDVKLGLNKLKDQKSRDLYIATRLVEKYILKGREKHITKEGKPYAIEGNRYNLSQVGEYVCVVESEYEVGIDIAKAQEFTAHFIDRMFLEEEKAQIKNDLDVLKFWTIKEATTKCVGIGLKGIRDVKVLSNDKCSYKDQEFNYKSFNFSDYIITVVQKEIIDIDNLTSLKVIDFINI